MSELSLVEKETLGGGVVYSHNDHLLRLARLFHQSDIPLYKRPIGDLAILSRDTYLPWTLDDFKPYKGIAWNKDKVWVVECTSDKQTRGYREVINTFNKLINKYNNNEREEKTTRQQVHPKTEGEGNSRDKLRIPKSTKQIATSIRLESNPARFITCRAEIRTTTLKRADILSAYNRVQIGN